VSKIIEFKPRKPPQLSAEELAHYHSIICELSELTPQDRLSIIAASCDRDEWQAIFELSAYGIATELPGQDVNLIRQALHDAVEKVIREATAGETGSS
jgi:hypothetical protein